MLKLAKNQANATAELFYLKTTRCFLHPRYHSKVREYLLKNVQKTIVSVLMTVMRLYDY